MPSSMILSASDGAAARRALTIPAVLVSTVIVWALVPVLLVTAVAVDLVRRRGLATVRVLAFLVTYVTAESVGICALMLAWLRFRTRTDALLEATYAIQGAWTRALLHACARIFALRFEVEGDACVTPGPVLVLSRHASIVDTLLPSVFLAERHGLRLRFVLKRELLWDPCLDIAGNRLPNHFVTRTSEGSAEDLEAIRDLAGNLGPSDGVLIFPEGTRFSPAKRARALASLATRDSDTLARAAALQHTLPPKPGGVLALLDGAPEADVVLLAHTGLEGFSHVRDIWRGALLGRVVRMRVWRIARAHVPTSADERRAFLQTQWLAIDGEVGRLAALQ